MTPDQCARELARLLDEQAAICSQILEKSKMQQSMVEERREDELLTLLTDKQRLIDQHESLTKQAQPFRKEWEDSCRMQAGPAAHAMVEKAWNGLRTVLDEIVKLEDASRAYLQEQKDKVSKDINKLQRGKIVNKAYGSSGLRPPPTPRFSDKEG